jgi:drug/metabolite transporter (DMT)-like permease
MVGAVRTEGGPVPVRSVAVQYLALAAVWGSSFLFVEVALEGLSAVQVVLGRLLAGALTLLVVLVWRGQRLPREPVVWGHLAVVAVLLCVAPFLLFAWAQEHVSSGLASIYNATTPLMTMLVTLAALRQERPTPSRLTGLVTGFLGVAVVLAPWRGVEGGGLLAQAACLAATACYGVAFVHLRRFVTPRGLGAVPVATVQVGLGAATMLLAAPWTAAQPVDLTPAVVGAVAALGMLGTGLAYVWNTNVVAGWGATTASTVTYLTPLVGVVLGVVVLAETPSWNQPLGALLVVLGIAVGQDRLAPLARRLTGRLVR